MSQNHLFYNGVGPRRPQNNVFIIVLSFILGEKRVLILSIFSTFLVLFIYVGFNIGFNIFLPESKILKQVLEGILN